MRNQQASVLPLPASRPGIAGRRAPSTRGVVISLRGPAAETDDSSTWDELTKLALEGWCWRDPESLARIEACVRRLWPEVEREWGEPRAPQPIPRLR